MLVNGDSLTTDPRCCCYEPPPPAECPPCCVRIDWGQFDENGDLVGQDAADGETIEIKITMPTKFSRIVCDDESITVLWGIDEADPLPGGGYAQFGAAWVVSDETPGATKVFERGLVDWVGVDSESFGLTLKLSSCFLDDVQFLGYLTIGLDSPEWSEEIEIFRCPTAERCCPPPYECEPCCFEIVPSSTAIFFEGKLWAVVDLENGYRLIVQITTETAGLWCPDDTVQIDFQLIPPRWDDEAEYNAVVTWGDPWLYDQNSPDIAMDGEIDANRPPDGGGKIDWGTLAETDYLAVLVAGCGELFCNVYDVEGISIVVNGLPGDSNIGLSITFDPCEEDLTGCCCPPWCECGCYFPLSTDFCEDALVDEGEPSTNPDDIVAGLYEVDGPSRINFFNLQVTADQDVYCNGSTDEITISGTFESDNRHYGQCVMESGKLCPRSLFLAIKVSDESLTCPSPQFPAGITPPHYWMVVDLINCNETNNVSVESFGDSLWRGEPNGPQLIALLATLEDCNRITGSGSFEEGGINFNWTLTIELSGPRECPCE